MPSLTKVRTDVDTLITTHWPVIQTRQEVRRASAARYFQGLWTHTVAPLHTQQVDGKAVPDNLAAFPSDRSERWSDFMSELATIAMPCRFLLSYFGPPESYRLVAEFNHSGALHRRERIVEAGGPFVDVPWFTIGAEGA